jgi:hypothetical protein
MSRLCQAAGHVAKMAVSFSLPREQLSTAAPLYTWNLTWLRGHGGGR